MRRACRLFTFVENELMIRTKRERVVTGPDGKKRRSQLVPLRFNEVQIILAQELALAWHKGLPFRRLIPKARQMGISTWFQAIGFALCVNRPAYHVALIAHHEDGGVEIFEKAQIFSRSLRAGLAPDLDKRQGARLMWVNASSMWVGSIKTGDDLAKGPTLNMLHFSECANFPDKGTDAIGAAASALGALADDKLLIVGYESTAKGRDAFFWSECERALNPDVLTENRVLFLPWFLEPEYSMTWDEYKARLAGKTLPKRFVPTEDERILCNKLSRARPTKKNHNWVYRADLTDEQLIWRRFTIANDCFGKDHLFRRYYPSDYEEAFTSTVQCMFGNKTVEHYRRKATNAMARGNFVEAGSRPSFRGGSQGYTRMWKDVVPGEEYVIGADVGGERKGSDPCAAYVLNVHTMEVVAAIQGYMEFDEYADYLCLAGKYYNNARLAIENNHNPAVAKTCFKAGYPNLYHYVDEASRKLNIAPKPGFSTNRKTRPEAMAYLDRVTRDQTLVCWDKHLAHEMEHFVWVESEKRYRGTGSFTDDRIMALAIAVYVNQAAIERERDEPKKEHGWAYKLFLELERDLDDVEDEEVLML